MGCFMLSLALFFLLVFVFRPDHEIYSERESKASKIRQSSRFLTLITLAMKRSQDCVKGVLCASLLNRVVFSGPSFTETHASCSIYYRPFISCSFSYQLCLKQKFFSLSLKSKCFDLF